MVLYIEDKNNDDVISTVHLSIKLPEGKDKPDVAGTFLQSPDVTSPVMQAASLAPKMDSNDSS